MEEMKRLLIAILLLLSISSVTAQSASQYNTIQNLQSEWLAIDAQNRYIPFVASQGPRTTIGVSLDLIQYAGNQLRCCVPRNSAILINQQIIARATQDRCFNFSIDSLYRVYSQESLLLTVYQPQKALNKIRLSIVSINQNVPFPKNQIEERVDISKGDFFVVGLIALLVIYAVLINQYPKTFRTIYNLSGMLSFRMREKDMRIRLINQAHILFLVQHCLLVAFLLIMLVTSSPISSTATSYINFSPHTVSAFLLLWVEVSIIVLTTIWMKYVLIMLFGTLFKLRYLKNFHMFDFMRMSLIFWVSIFFLVVCTYQNVSVTDAFYSKMLIYLFIIFAVARIIILYLRLFKNAQFRNMYLFSYICTAEIIPLLVGLELLIGH